MKAAFASLARWFFKASYRICCFLPRRNEVLFLSRQVDEPGYNFRSLGSEFQRRGWIVSYLTKRLSKRAVASYSFHVVREIYHLARCRVCVLDRYDPVVGLLDFDCEAADGANIELAGSALLHTEFPGQPVVLQLWHAFGAFKKFGFQTRPKGIRLVLRSLSVSIGTIRGSYARGSRTGRRMPRRSRTRSRESLRSACRSTTTCWRSERR